MKRSWCRVLISCLLLGSSLCFAQQDFVSRYDVFTGFSYMASPKMDLDQRGFNGEFGVNLRRWLAVGVDYSVIEGGSSIVGADLTLPVQAQVAPFVQHIPPGYNFYLPYHSVTQTFSAGPQFNYRHWKAVTFFIRPAFGVMHEVVTPRPQGDPLRTVVLAHIVPTGQKSDTTYFYGAGGGFDWNATRRVGLRVGVDVVHTFLFEGFLAHSCNSVRVSVGPTFRFGSDIVR